MRTEASPVNMLKLLAIFLLPLLALAQPTQAQLACDVREPDQAVDLVCEDAYPFAVEAALWAADIPLCLVFQEPPANWPACFAQAFWVAGVPFCMAVVEPPANWLDCLTGPPDPRPFAAAATDYVSCYISQQPLLRWYPNCT